tara:strand:+ start:2556 stop:2723 length:168 start_codon:yes stop_codon:yes gene_type:complete
MNNINKEIEYLKRKIEYLETKLERDLDYGYSGEIIDDQLEEIYLLTNIKDIINGN